MEPIFEYKESQIAKLLSYARAISLNEISPLAIFEINRLLNCESIQEYFINVDVDIFKVVASELDEYPIGSQRSLWNPESLKAKDSEMEQIIDFYKPKLMDSASKIIEALKN